MDNAARCPPAVADEYVKNKKTDTRFKHTSPLDELAGAALTALCFDRCAPTRSSPRSPAKPDAGPLNAMK